MPVHRDFNPGRTNPNMRSTVTVLAIAAAAYVVGALVQDTLPPPNDSAAFARSLRAAGASSGNVPPAPAIPGALPSAGESRRPDAELIENPRECDLGRGISTACIFMD